MTHTGSASAPARWTAAVSTESTRSSAAMAPAVSAKSASALPTSTIWRMVAVEPVAVARLDLDLQR